MSEVVEWSDLPHDILAIICKPLTVPDIFSFAFVCRSWRSAAALNDAKQHLCHFEMQKPWLAFSGSETTVANFYSISDNRFFAIPDQPEGPSPFNTYFVIGSDYGWIIAADDRSELLLLNPITRQRIDLPPVSTFDNVTPQFKNDGGNQIITHYLTDSENGPGYGEITVEHHSMEDLRYNLYWKACLSSSPSMNDDYTVVVLLETSRCFAFAKSGDRKWTTILDPQDQLFDIDMAFFHNNDVSVVHFTDNNGRIRSCDLNSNKPKLTLTLPLTERDYGNNNFYLINSPWGDFLYVLRVRYYCDEIYSTLKIEVYKINLKSQTLVKVENLGKYALFVGSNNPICISVEDAAFLKKNCVYFTDEYSDYSVFAKDIRRDIGIYDLENGSIELILPNDSRLFWPPPFWFTPSIM